MSKVLKYKKSYAAKYVHIYVRKKKNDVDGNNGRTKIFHFRPFTRKQRNVRIYEYRE